MHNLHKTRIFLGVRSDARTDEHRLEYLVRGDCPRPTEIRQEETPPEELTSPASRASRWVAPSRDGSHESTDPMELVLYPHAGG